MKKAGISLPDWSLKTWTGVGILSFLLIAGISWWGWWNSWSFPDLTIEKYEYLNGPTVLEEVKEIGELVGAEYYGEVIHSLLEQQEEEDFRRLADLHEEVKLMYTRHFNAARNLPVRRGEGEVRQDALRRFALRVETLSNSAWYRNIFLKLGKSESELLEEIRQKSWEDFSTRYRDELLRQRRIQRQDLQSDPVLIYLGRGDVLIGFDLKQLRTDQMIRQGDTLILKDLDPTVISAAINPWYLAPDQDSTGKGIPGFESLRQEGEVSADMVAEVKSGAKDELIREAFRNGTPELAEASAEQTLLSFFNLLARPEEQLSVLDIQPSIRYLQLQSWTEDLRIDATEAEEIKSAAQADSLSADWLPVLEALVPGWGHDISWYEMVSQ